MIPGNEKLRTAVVECVTIMPALGHVAIKATMIPRELSRYAGSTTPRWQIHVE
jgi:hypothetical protein